MRGRCNGYIKGSCGLCGYSLSELKEKLFTLYKSIMDEAGKIFRECGYKDVLGESSKGYPDFVYTFEYRIIIFVICGVSLCMIRLHFCFDNVKLPSIRL